MGEEIIKVIEALCEKFGLAVDWTSENVLPYVELLGRRIVTYELWSSVVYLILGILLLIVVIFAFKFFCKKDEEGDMLAIYGDDLEMFLGMGAFILGLCALIFGLTICCIQIPDIIECLTFPEKVIWDEIQGLLQ